VDLDQRTCDRARRARDPRFDGRFVIAVTTTRVYCRPVCPVRAPRDEHIRYFPSADAAAAAGYRPCLRCRPEASPGTPAWGGTSATVSRALRLIGEGALDGSGVETLAGRVGVTGRHLRRLFLEHVGAPPLAVALTRRVHFAKRLLDDTTLPMADVALAAGFASLRRFNDQMRRTFARTPSELRRRPRTVADDAHGVTLRLAFRPPYDWPAMLAFLAARATPGVERVTGGEYRRTIASAAGPGVLTVSSLAPAHGLRLDVSGAAPRDLLAVVERVRHLFDLRGDPATVAAHLGGDPLLAAAVRRRPGLRVPGAWDGFELAVRAVLGQQVSVRAATTLSGRLAAQWGTPVSAADGLDRLYPTPSQLADAPLEEVGVLPSRAATIRAVARGARDGALTLTRGADLAATMAALGAVPGIGPWTAQYIAMRALGDPDAFLAGDLILRRAAGGITAPTLERRAESWRPWRAYAVLWLWHGEADRAASSSQGRAFDDSSRDVRAGSDDIHRLRADGDRSGAARPGARPRRRGARLHAQARHP
jgi:AraC family transcriptional regulator of adaptative response / DNA-3-methyladenine glycosylase II